jgi:hypothetical protein
LAGDKHEARELVALFPIGFEADGKGLFAGGSQRYAGANEEEPLLRGVGHQDDGIIVGMLVAIVGHGLPRDLQIITVDSDGDRRKGGRRSVAKGAEAVEVDGLGLADEGCKLRELLDEQIAPGHPFGFVRVDEL